MAVNAKITREQIASVTKALTAAVQLENQCTTSADCATAAVGSRACGGPNSYVVYSTMSSNAENIRSLAQLTTRLEQQYNQENSIMSICSMVMPPTAVCDQSSKCVASSTFSPFEPVPL